MTAQTSYSFYQSVPFAGVLADSDGSDADIRSYVSEELTAGLPFGIAVCQGAADTGCLLMVDTNSKILGITVHQHAFDPYYLPASPTTAGVPLKGTVGVLRRGRIWAIAEVAVVPMDIVCARYTTTAAPKNQLGGLGNTTDSATAKQITAAVWSTTAAAAALGIVDISTP